MKYISQGLQLVLLLGLTILHSPAAQAQGAHDYPNKIIKFIVGYGAGGITDITARLVASELETTLGQKIIVENRPGASGVIGAGAVAKSPADGYTLYFAIGSHTIAPAINKQITYDTVKDFTAISQVSSTPNMFAVKADSPIKSLADLVQAAKEKPGVLTYSSPGYGTTTHLTVAIIEQAAGVKFTHVPYKTSTAAVEAASTGEVTLASTSIFTGGAMVKEGKMRALAVVGDKRMDAFPDVPTFKELGYQGVIGDSWMGLLAPAGTPKVIVAKLEAAVGKAFENDEFRKKMLNLGALPVASSAEAFQKRIEYEVREFKTLAEKTNLKVE